MPMQATSVTETTPNRFAQELFDGLPRRYDRLAEVLSFGQNARWRRAMVDRVAGTQWGRILDVAAGTAGVSLALAERTNAHVTGIDLTEAMLREGRARVRRREAAPRVTLLAGRAEALPFPDASFDALTFTYLLRYVADPAETVRELARVLQPGAPMASLDFAVPTGMVWHSAWWLYTRALLPVGGLLGGPAWVRVGRFLGPNISGFYRAHPVDTIVDAWCDAGMVDVRTRTMSLGGGLVMWGRKGHG
jgi:demethylmenaquinone methyltransferase/2-methoxy-6-polyprenyl-1,4-benzoquinol methylase